MNIIEKDILTVEFGVICHQVNARGVMGAGLALQIRNKYPQVYSMYVDALRNKRLALGQVQYVQVDRDLVVANLVGQENIGRGKQTDIDALRACFESISHFDWSVNHFQIYLPYGIGCSLGGGSWQEVSRLIDMFLPDAIVCILPKNTIHRLPKNTGY